MNKPNKYSKMYNISTTMFDLGQTTTILKYVIQFLTSEMFSKTWDQSIYKKPYI